MKSKELKSRNVPIEIIAATLENRLLVEKIEDASDFFNEEIEFIKFITNNEISIPTLQELECIKKEILKQHKDLTMFKYNTSDMNLTVDDIRSLLMWYRTVNGLSKKIKPMDKVYSKTLKMQE